MTKAFFLIGSALAALCIAQSPNKNFARFKAIEAYEVRPGILMLPRYTADGQICEIDLEKLHHSDGEISLEPTFTEAEVDEIADQLVPTDERGPKPKKLLEQGSMELLGLSAVSSEEYQNISIETYRAIHGTSPKGEVVLGEIAAATIKWKHRTCEQRGHQPQASPTASASPTQIP